MMPPPGCDGTAGSLGIMKEYGMRRLSVLASVLALGFATVVGGDRMPVNAQEGTPEATETAMIEGVTTEQVSFGIAETLPPPPVTVDFFRVRIEPGGGYTAPESDPGVGLYVVEFGAVTLRNFSADVVVTRAADAVTAGAPAREVIPAGIEVTLLPGDSFTWETFVAGDVRNYRTEPVVLAVILIAPVDSETPEAGTTVATPVR
jgi:hypothetical protein